MKEESGRNETLIKRQRDQEAAKNNSIKEMIRRQKMDAEERKALVSIVISIIKLTFYFTVE